MKKITADKARAITAAAKSGKKEKEGHVADPDEVKLIVKELLAKVQPNADIKMHTCFVSVGGYSKYPMGSNFSRRFEDTGEQVRKQVEKLGFTLTTSIFGPSPWVQPEEEYAFSLSWE